MQNAQTQKRSMTELTEAIAKTDFETLEDAVAHLSDYGGLQGILAVKRLVIAGDAAVAILIEVLRRRDLSRSTKAMDILLSFYRHKRLLHPEFVPLLYQILSDPVQSNAQEKALGILSELARDKAIPEIHDYFVVHLFSDDARLRKYAIQYFVQSNNASTVPLLTLLLDDDHETRQRSIRYTLEEIGSPEARFALYEWAKRQKYRP